MLLTHFLCWSRHLGKPESPLRSRILEGASGHGRPQPLHKGENKWEKGATTSTQRREQMREGATLVIDKIIKKKPVKHTGDWLTQTCVQSLNICLQVLNSCCLFLVCLIENCVDVLLFFKVCLQPFYYFIEILIHSLQLCNSGLQLLCGVLIPFNDLNIVLHLDNNISDQAVVFSQPRGQDNHKIKCWNPLNHGCWNDLVWGEQKEIFLLCQHKLNSVWIHFGLPTKMQEYSIWSHHMDRRTSHFSPQFLQLEPAFFSDD